MKLRIIGGEFGGRNIYVPDNDTAFRPTKSQCREAVSNILAAKIPGATVADICAGSGAFGFEMLSRGAALADLVESDRRRAESILKNARELKVSNAANVFPVDARKFLRDARKLYSLIYFDPPYDDVQLDALTFELRSLLDESGILVHERRTKRPAVFTHARPEPFDSRKYGDSTIDFFHRS